jgi:hypothetical protein
MPQNGLLDFLQGASNSAASNVSAPIDGINWLLRKAGLPVSEKPFLGSDWMAAQGLTREPQNRNMGLLGEAIGGVLPMVAAAKAPQIARGLLQGAENMAAPRMLNPQAGAIGPFHNDVLASMSKGIPDDVASSAFGRDGFIYHTPYRPFENAQSTAIGGGSPISERVFSTTKPLTASQLKSIEAVPVSDMATNAFAKELSDEGAIGFLNKDGKRFSVVTPSAKNQGQFQATQYDPRGAIGDSQHQSSADAIQRLIDGGYSKILDDKRIENFLRKVML